MNSAERSLLHQALLSRRDAIADRWYKAIAPISHVLHSVSEVHRHLDEWTEEAIALLFTEPFEHGRAEAIGASLARLHYLEPETLGRTQEVLAQQFTEGLPVEQAVELQPPVAALLGGVATGFLQQARETTLAEQEQVRGAIAAEVGRMKEALWRSRDELEQRVEERTAELATANEQLKREITERVRAGERIRQRNKELSAVSDIARAVNHSLDLQNTLEVGIREILKTVGGQAGCILLLKDKSPRWVIKAQQGINQELLERLDEAVRGNGSWPVEGEPWSDLLALWSISDEIKKVMRRAGFRAFDVLPLQSRVDMLGMVVLTSREEGLLGLQSIEALMIIAEQLGTAVKNAQLYQEAQRELAERVRAEAALRESQETARALLNAPTDVAVLIDAEGIVLDANETAVCRFHKHLDELVGSCVWDLFPPDVTEHREAYVDGVIASSKPVRFEDEREGIWNDNVIYPVLSASEQVTKVAVLARDITERKRREEEIRQRNRELAALNVIAATVNQSLDLGAVLDEALAKVLETMELEVGAIRLLNEQSGTLDLKVHRGMDLSPHIVERISQAKLAEGPLAETIASGEPLIMEDLSAHPIVELMGKRDLKSLAMIPLRSKGRVLGTMEVVSPNSRRFTSEEMQLLTSIGHQVGVAVENARLYTQAQTHAAQLASLLQVGQSLTSSLNLDRTLYLIVEQAAKLLDTDVCCLCVYDADRDELLSQATYGASDEDLRGAAVLLFLSQTVAEARATWKPAVVEDTSQNHRVPAEIAEQWGIKSVLTVPLVAEGQFLGLILLGETEAPRHFIANEIELVQSFASQAAIALQNAQLYARSEELAISSERNRVAREIHDDLIQRLASLLMRVDLCLEMMDEEPEETKRELDRLGVALQDSIQATRRSILALRPLALEQLGFRQALCTYADDFAQQNGICVHVLLPEEGLRLPAKMEYTLFRIVQEGLNNVRWHAQADTVWVDLNLRPPGEIWLEIRDNGRGFDLARKNSYILEGDSRGRGLLHMQERVEAMRGRFRIETVPTGGTKIGVTIPLEN